MIYTNFKEIDKLGRIVISKDIRKHLNINTGDALKIEADDDSIIIRKAENKCIFCNSSENLKKHMNKCVCQECLNSINSEI